MTSDALTPQGPPSPAPSQGLPALKRTPLYDRHAHHQARLVEFGGWEMPVQYSGIVEEHHAVRQAAGLFDVSHMGELRVAGPAALAFVQRVVANDVARLTPGTALYTQLTRPDGGTVDDLLVYAEHDGSFLLVVNASNIDKDRAWLESHLIEGVTLSDESDDTAMLALQGPLAEQMLATRFEPAGALSGLKSFHWLVGRVDGIAVRVARTGYTGEDGFEIFSQAADASALWDALMAAGSPLGLLPVGLGARDTLRLEAGLPLYGHELTDAIGPVQAGFGWSVKTQKADFLGREVFSRQKQGELDRKVVGLRLSGRQIARQGYAVFAGDRQVGEILSGTFSPTLQAPIATALVEVAALSGPLTVQIRTQQAPATLVPLPFYRRPQ